MGSTSYPILLLHHLKNILLVYSRVNKPVNTNLFTVMITTTNSSRQINMIVVC